jgi:regulation of enolase protein 1 (concanavalin A-like superfamily)
MSEPLLHEDFRAAALDSRLAWFNPPKHWRLEARGPGLVVEPDGQTDFWQRTHYGFSADNGHFLSLELRGDFVLSTEVRFHPVHQYDQAGLMIRGDANCWIKASVEHELEGRPQLGAVVTNNGYSDWSLQDFPFSENTVRWRITRNGADVRVEFSPAGRGQWKLMRVARWHWPDPVPLRAGLYACSPKDAGFRAEFAFLRVEFTPAQNPEP